ncbi:MIP/aquaporin family protein [Ruminococcus flavefaciens]|uniref:Aquaporin Z n=1 Tax=Ruminococcus flavefaciens TaxID=1265 RepID=A0A1M7HAI9_RUMFL|nr:aquaporin Z [Ruminococcus flavefaciens]
MESIKKYIAEVIGTFVLVLLGCGTAMLVGCDAVNGGGYILTALAFGLVIVGMAYCIGNISGCHINPAVSLGVLLSGGMTFTDFIGYIVSQCVGAIAGAGVLKAIFDLGDVVDKTGGYGSNGLGGVNGSAGAGILVEILLTFIFVMTILGVTSKKAKHGSFGGLIIGLTLTLVHIFGIGLTGTSVNPARSLGPALLAGGDALSDLWVFIVGPFAGAILAACVYKFLESSNKSVPEKAPAPVKNVSAKPAQKKKKK